MAPAARMAERLFTIAICTFDRAALLDDALASLAAIAAGGPPPFDVLVVDNNSTDDTRGVAGRWGVRAAFPVRYVREPRQGLSVARNRAVRETAAEWLWYVDDDVLFAPGWVDGVVDGLRRFPDAAAFAGAVALAFEPDAPAWLPAAALPYYGRTAHGDVPRLLGPRQYPVGANMGFRRTVLDDVGRFCESLGRVGTMLRSSEESDLVDRLHARGREVAYVPAAGVRHRILPDRASMRWLRRRAYWGGITYVMTNGHAAGGRPRAALRLAARALGTVARATLAHGLSPERQLDYAWQLGTARGYLASAVRGASEPAS
jgi:glycosyltransferase involved in cell wall biosynthesis